MNEVSAIINYLISTNLITRKGRKSENVYVVQLKFLKLIAHTKQNERTVACFDISNISSFIVNLFFFLSC